VAERVHAGTGGRRASEGIGVDADEQVGLHAACLLHAHAQGHEEVAVARHVGPHGAAVDRALVDAVAQQLGDLQDHVLLIGALGADGAGVLAAMAGVQRHDDDAVGLARRRGAGGHGAARCFGRGGSRCGRRRRRGCWGCRRGGGGVGLAVLGDQVAQRVLGRCGGAGAEDRWKVGVAAGIAQPLLDQRLQRVHGLGGVEVEHQPVLVAGHGLEREHLGHGILLEVDHQAHHVRAVLPHPDGRDVRVVRPHLGHQFLEGAVELQALDVHGQPGW